MVVLFVVLFFAAFVVIDILRERRHAQVLLQEGEALHSAVEAAEPTFVAGFKLPPLLSYHRGHTWVHQVSPELAYVGVDDFARRLGGRGARYSAPSSGKHVSQGQPVILLERDGRKVRLASPVSGEIVGVNPRLKGDPDLPFDDAYGRGWIFKIRSPHLFKDLGNLLGGSLAKKWIEDTRERFQYRMMMASGSVLQDGGAPVEDIASAVEPGDWKELVDEFLTVGPEK